MDTGHRRAAGVGQGSGPLRRGASPGGRRTHVAPCLAPRTRSTGTDRNGRRHPRSGPALTPHSDAKSNLGGNTAEITRFFRSDGSKVHGDDDNPAGGSPPPADRAPDWGGQDYVRGGQGAERGRGEQGVQRAGRAPSRGRGLAERQYQHQPRYTRNGAGAPQHPTPFSLFGGSRCARSRRLARLCGRGPAPPQVPRSKRPAPHGEAMVPQPSSPPRHLTRGQ